MINTKSNTTLLQDISYNKITILISLSIILLTQAYPQYIYGPIIWAEFFILIIYFLLVCNALGILGIIGFFGLGSIFLTEPFKPFKNSFWDALTFSGDPDQYGLAGALISQKDYFLTHPGLVSFFTSLAFLFILWQHPKAYEKRCAHSPMKILDCLIKYNDVKIIATIFTFTYLFTTKFTATIAAWTIAFFLTIEFANIGKKELHKENIEMIAGYLLIFGGYTILSSDKAPLDVILGIITLNP